MSAKANRGMVIVVAFLAVLTGACTDGPRWGSVQDAAGERQRVLCRGATGTAVVFVHGIGDEAGSSSFAKVLAGLPADRRVCRYDRPGTGDSPPPLSALGAASWAEVHMAAEDLNLPLVQEQTASTVAGRMPAVADLPLTVIRREKSTTPAWLDAQERLAALSSKGRLVVAARSGHQVPYDAPAAVVDAITDFPL